VYISSSLGGPSDRFMRSGAWLARTGFSGGEVAVEVCWGGQLVSPDFLYADRSRRGWRSWASLARPYSWVLVLPIGFTLSTEAFVNRWLCLMVRVSEYSLI
jgi:hypothetical protein